MVTAGKLSTAAAIGDKAKEMLKEMNKKKKSPTTPSDVVDLSTKTKKRKIELQFGGNSKARTLAIGLGGITKVLSESLVSEDQHRKNMHQLMINELSFRKDQLLFRKQQAIITNSSDELLSLVAAGVPFKQAQEHVTKQKNEALMRLQNETPVDLR